MTWILESVSVVIPALNEERNIGWVLARIPAWVDEVIVVNGRSSDDTDGAALRARPDVVLLHELRHGKGSAVRAGLARASGDVVALLDADGSMEPQELGRFLEALGSGADLAKGSRFMPGGASRDITRTRAIGNRMLVRSVNLLYGARFTELCYGYMALRRSAIPRLGLSADGFEIETQIVTHSLRAGLRVTEVPSVEAPRRAGESNLHPVRDGTRVLRELLRARVRNDLPTAPAVPSPVRVLA
jgi:glycosyltransferase involved in cell wall biosynthesis